MKNIFSLLAALLFITVSATAQTYFTPALDTTANATTRLLTSGIYIGTGGTFSINALVTKIAGTISGNIILQQSMDGTNWQNMECPCNYGTTVNVPADTVAVVNQTPVYPITWNCTGIKNKYYRVESISAQTTASYSVAVKAVKD